MNKMVLLAASNGGRSHHEWLRTVGKCGKFSQCPRDDQFKDHPAGHDDQLAVDHNNQYAPVEFHCDYYTDNRYVYAGLPHIDHIRAV